MNLALSFSLVSKSEGATVFLLIAIFTKIEKDDFGATGPGSGAEDLMPALGDDSKSARRKSTGSFREPTPQFGVRSLLIAMACVAVWATLHHYVPQTWLVALLVLDTLILLAVCVVAAASRNAYVHTAGFASLLPVITSAYVVCWMAVFTVTSFGGSVNSEGVNSEGVNSEGVNSEGVNSEGVISGLDVRLAGVAAMAQSTLWMSVICAVVLATFSCFLKWLLDRGGIGFGLTPAKGNDARVMRKRLVGPSACWVVLVILLLAYLGSYLSLSTPWVVSRPVNLRRVCLTTRFKWSFFNRQAGLNPVCGAG